MHHYASFLSFKFYISHTWLRHDIQLKHADDCTQCSFIETSSPL